MWSRVRHRRLQALALVALAAPPSAAARAREALEVVGLQDWSAESGAGHRPGHVGAAAALAAV